MNLNSNTLGIDNVSAPFGDTDAHSAILLEHACNQKRDVEHHNTTTKRRASARLPNPNKHQRRASVLEHRFPVVSGHAQRGSMLLDARYMPSGELPFFMSSDYFPPDIPGPLIESSVRAQDTNFGTRSSIITDIKGPQLQPEVSLPMISARNEVPLSPSAASIHEDIPASIGSGPSEAAETPSPTALLRATMLLQFDVGDPRAADYSPDDQERMSTAAELLLALEERKSAFSVNLILYKLQSSRGESTKACLPRIFAVSRSVTNEVHALLADELLRSSVNEITLEGHTSSEPILYQEHAKLYALLNTLKLRVLAASLAEMQFSVARAEKWNAEVQDTLNHAISTEHNLDRRDFDLRKCSNGPQIEWISKTAVTLHNRVSPCLLSYAISKIEATLADSQSIPRTRAIREALASCEAPSLNVIRRDATLITRSTSMAYIQRVYLAWYSSTWESLSQCKHSFESPSAKTFEERCGITAAKLAGLVVKMVIHFSPDELLATRDWVLWIDNLPTRFHRLLQFSNEELSLWLDLAARTAEPIWPIPQGAIFDLVLEKTGIDMRLNPIRPQSRRRETGDVENGRVSTIHDGTSSRNSVMTTSSSFRYMKSLMPKRYRKSAVSQETLPPSRVYRDSQRSDWSGAWDPISILSHRLSRASISTKGSRKSRFEPPKSRVSMVDDAEIG